jgi:hypothetical protein
MTTTIDKFLFDGGFRLENYFIRATPVSEVLCYVDSGGKEFYLPISDDELADAAIRRLKDLGVRIVKAG